MTDNITGFGTDESTGFEQFKTDSNYFPTFSLLKSATMKWTSFLRMSILSVILVRSEQSDRRPDKEWLVSVRESRVIFEHESLHYRYVIDKIRWYQR